MRSSICSSFVSALILLAAGDALAQDGIKPYSPQATLSLDGAQVGGVVGSDLATYASSQVVSINVSGSAAQKHIGGVKYEDMEISVGPDAGSPLFDWISSSLLMRFQRKNGALDTTDGSRAFFNALISEVRFPVLDAASTAMKGIAVRFSPEYTRYTKGATKAAASRTTLFSSSGFRFTLDGVNTKGIRRIDELAIKVKVAESAVGELRDYQKEPTTIEYPNIRLYVSPADAADFIAWHEDFVLKGNCGDDREKTGSIALLASNGKDTAAELKLIHVGIFALHDVMLAGSRALQVDLYAERMELVRPGATAEAAPQPTGELSMTVTARKAVPNRISSGKRQLDTVRKIRTR